MQVIQFSLVCFISCMLLATSAGHPHHHAAGIGLGGPVGLLLGVGLLAKLLQGDGGHGGGHHHHVHHVYVPVPVHHGHHHGHHHGRHHGHHGAYILDNHW